MSESRHLIGSALITLIILSYIKEDVASNTGTVFSSTKFKVHYSLPFSCSSFDPAVVAWVLSSFAWILAFASMLLSFLGSPVFPSQVISSSPIVYLTQDLNGS